MMRRLGWRLWIGVAIVLAALGGRFGRRAAGRGLVGLAAAMVTRRDRPRSTTAAGFAFAAGAAMELPAAALPLGAMAVAASVAEARRTRLAPHALLASAASGLSIGVGTRRIWPVAPHDPAATRTASVATSEVDAPERSRLVVVVNASAGSALAENPAEQIRVLLPDAEVVVVEDSDDWPAAWRRAAEADVVGVCGGDGSVNEAARTAHAAGKPLLVFPGGTLNHFAKALGINSLEDAAAALTDGRAVAVDVGVVGDRVFLNVASVGVYVDLVEKREQLEGRIGKWPALVIALGRVLRKASAFDVELDGRPRRIWMAFIGNCLYQPTGFAPSWRERLDDNQLDIRLVDATSPFSRTRLVLAVMTGLLGRSRVYEAYTAERIGIRSSDGPLGFAIDGEVCDGAPQLTFEKADKQLIVFAPA